MGTVEMPFGGSDGSDLANGDGLNLGGMGLD